MDFFTGIHQLRPNFTSSPIKSHDSDTVFSRYTRFSEKNPKTQTLISIITFRWIEGCASRFQGLIFAHDVFLTLLRIQSIYFFWNPGRSPTLDFQGRSVIGQQVMLTDGQHVTRHIKMSAKASRTQCAAWRALSLPP